MSTEKRIRPEFTQQEVNTVLQTEEVKKLLQLLKKDGGAGFTQASEALKRVDLRKIAPLLKPLLDNPDAEMLMQKISQKLERS